MIWKIGLYLLIGAILNLGAAAWIILWAVSKDRDGTFAITNDIMQKYEELVFFRIHHMFFWEHSKDNESDEEAESETKKMVDDFNREGLSGGELLVTLIVSAILWPVEIFYTKCWTIPRIVEYAKKYDET